MAPTAEDVGRVLSHIQARQRSHPGSPATGLYWMTDEYWQSCINILRAQGYRISKVISAGGDHAANATGYIIEPTEHT